MSWSEPDAGKPPKITRVSEYARHNPGYVTRTPLTCPDTLGHMANSDAPHGDPKRYRSGCKCQICRDGWAAHNRAKRQARAALKARPADVGRQAAADPWASETPYTGHALTPRPNPDQRAECGSCGQPTTQSTPRGTFRWCDDCGRQFAAETRRGLDAAAAALENARQLAADKAAAARADRPRPFDERLDIAGKFGALLDLVNSTITRLRGASPELATEAATATGRLLLLRDEINRCQGERDPMAALAELGPYIRAEGEYAGDVAVRIEAERMAIETDAAMNRELTRRLEARSANLALESAPARVPSPVDLNKLVTRSGPITHAWDQLRAQHARNGPCQMPHRHRTPAATIELVLSGQAMTPERIRICSTTAHDPSAICRGHGFTHYQPIPLDRTEGTPLWVSGAAQR